KQHASAADGRPEPSALDAAAALLDGGAHPDQKAGTDATAEGSGQQPTAAMMQQLLANAANGLDAGKSAELAALKAAEKAAGGLKATLNGQPDQTGAADGQPATAGPDASATVEAQAKRAAIEITGEATRTHAAKSGPVDDGDQKSGDLAKLADFDTYLAQTTTN